MSPRASRIAAFPLLVLAVPLALAAAGPGAEEFRPKGPIKVSARHAEFDERGKRMLYRGKVILVSEEMELTGDRMELERAGKGVYKAHITGSPARLKHAGTSEVPELSASANDIVYDTEASTVALSGQAMVMRGDDELSGDSIRYNATTRRIKASGTNGSRIRLVIENPTQREKTAP